MTKGKVFISANPVKISERIDLNGNVIDLKTKQILVPKEPDSIAQPPAPPLTTPPVIVKDDGLSILEQIEATKRKLAELKELKKLKIAEKKAELELLEQ